jgi:hypothetical protein
LETNGDGRAVGDATKSPETAAAATDLDDDHPPPTESSLESSMPESKTHDLSANETSPDELTEQQLRAFRLIHDDPMATQPKHTEQLEASRGTVKK